MAEPRRISGKRLVLGLLVLPAMVVLTICLFFNERIVDGKTPVLVRLPADQGTVMELRYWAFPSSTDQEADREIAPVAEKKAGGFECLIPYSYNEAGWLFTVRSDTAPLPKQFAIWVRRGNGVWTRQTVQMPAPNARGNYEVIAAGL